MSSLLGTLLVIEVVLTAVGVVLYVYRSTLEYKEENNLILSQAESHLADGQAAIHAKANRLGNMLKWLGIAWLICTVATVAVWLGEGAGLL